MKRYNNLSRPKKAALNLTLADVLLFALWAYFGYPLPTTEMEFRKLEKQNLRHPSEIVQHLERDQSFVSDLTLGDIFIGISDKDVAVGYIQHRGAYGSSLEVWPLLDGPTPVPISCIKAPWDEKNQWWTSHAMCFVNVPKEAVRAQVVLEGDPFPSNLTNGQWMENGVFAFRFVSRDDELARPCKSEDFEGVSYTLRLYDERDVLILEQEGVIPKI